MNITIISGTIISLGRLSYQNDKAYLEMIVRTESPHPRRGQSWTVVLAGNYAAMVNMWAKKDDWVCISGMLELPSKVRPAVLCCVDTIPFSSVKTSPNRRPLKRFFNRFIENLLDEHYEFRR